MKLSTILRPCMMCNSTGARPGYEGEPCRACMGAGHHLNVPAAQINLLLQQEQVH